MANTNLDKFYAIQKIMNQVESLKEPYIKALEERHQYMSEYRKEYRKLVRALHDIRHNLDKEDKHEEEVQIIIKSARIQLRKQLEAYEEKKELDPFTDYDKTIKGLNEAIESMYEDVSLNMIENVRAELSSYKIKLKELDALVELMEVKKNGNDEQKAKIIELINIAENDYLNGFKAYREACENDEGVVDMFDDIFSVLAQLGYDVEASIMADALPDYEEERKVRPQPDDLLDVLQPIKSANLEYWQSNRRKAVAYEYNMAFAREVAYTRRALLEDREYNGTVSAFDRLQSAYDDLSDYMYDRYHELGGTPYNYHGHMDRIK